MANPKYDNVTFYIGLPRSRTAWLCAFLKRGNAFCSHDPLKTCESIEDLAKQYVDPFVQASSRSPSPFFIADTSAAFFFDEIYERFPNARYLVVRRALSGVIKSLRASTQIELDAVTSRMLKICKFDVDGAADFLIADRSAYKRIVDYNNLSDPQELRNIWRFVGNTTPLSDEYAQEMLNTNITIPWEEQRRKTNVEKVRKLFASAGFSI